MRRRCRSPRQRPEKRRPCQRGFYIPHRLAAEAAAAATTGYPELVPLFGAAEAAMGAIFDEIDGIAEALRAIDRAADPPPAPRLRQDWFPRLDAAAAYALVRGRRPASVVEIGCGHSTRWFARAVADGGLATRLTAIDPRPRATLAGLPVTFLRTTLQKAGTGPFAELTSGDILSLDGSHVLMPGTDVDIVLNRVMPELPPGVLVHLHDIFLPDPYPVRWLGRGYNEQQAVAPLLSGAGWRLLWSSHWAATRMADRLSRSAAADLPLLPGAFEASLWLEKRRDSQDA